LPASSAVISCPSGVIRRMGARARASPAAGRSSRSAPRAAITAGTP
jgi:hypothetical protein